MDGKRKDGRPNEKKDNVKQKGKENVKDREEKEKVTKTSRNQKLKYSEMNDIGSDRTEKKRKANTKKLNVKPRRNRI